MADYYSEERMRLANELLAQQGRLNDTRMAANEFRAALLDALGMDPQRDNDDIVNAARGLRRERDALSATVQAFPDGSNAANIAHARCQRDKAEAALARVRAFAEELRDYCSPHGVSVVYADQLEAILNGGNG